MCVPKINARIGGTLKEHIRANSKLLESSIESLERLGFYAWSKLRVLFHNKDSSMDRETGSNAKKHTIERLVRGIIVAKVTVYSLGHAQEIEQLWNW